MLEHMAVIVSSFGASVGTVIFKEIFDRRKKDIADKGRERSGTLKFELDAFEAMLKEATSWRFELRNEIASLRSELTEMEQNYERHRGEYEVLKAKHTELSARYAALEAQYNELQALYNATKAELEQLRISLNR